MIELYAEVKLVHVGAILVSGVLLLIRGLAAQAGASWPMSGLVRYLSYGVDTVLLTAALMLSDMLRQYPFVHSWITAKVVLLVVYIGLGGVALKKDGRASVRLWCWVGALGVYGLMYSIARAHHPLGLLRGIYG
jgi:uncharacterized membrane protein SirB2